METHIKNSITGSMKRVVVSDRLLEDPLSEARRRTPILVNLLAISACAAVMLAIGLAALYNISGEPLHLAALCIVLVTLFGYLTSLWYFQTRKQWIPSTYLYGATTTFGTIAPFLITGGIVASPYGPLVLVVPTFLFLIAGPRYGMGWALVVTGCMGMLFLLELLGVRFPQAIPDDLMSVFRFGTWLMTLMLLIIGLASYEFNFEVLTERISAERSKFAHEATHDPLTGLSNRKQFYLRAQEAVDYAVAHKHKAALIFIDLDDFKQVNDNFGHEIGDDFLNAIAQCLQESVRSMDTVARLGGDEFAVVLHGLTNTEVVDTMLEKLASVLSKPLAIGDNILRASGSFGVALAPDQGTEVEQLLRIADQTMYGAKQQRKSQLATRGIRS